MTEHFVTLNVKINLKNQSINDMNILALDLAKQCGYATRLNDGTIASGSTSFAQLPGQPIGYLFAKYERWLLNQMVKTEADFIAYEMVNFKMTRSWAAIYHGMVAIAQSASARIRIDCRGYPVRDVKFAATGKAKADKPDMIRTARLMWPEQSIVDDNQADALWVLYVAMKSLGVEVRAHPEMLI